MAAILRTPNGVTSAENGSSNSLVINVPSGTVNGDTLALVACHDLNGETLAVTGGGWDSKEAQASGSHDGALWTRTASSEPASYTVTSTGAVSSFGLIMFAINPDGGVFDAIEAADTTANFNASGTTAVTSSVTADAGGFFAALFLNDGSRGVATPPTGTSLITRLDANSITLEGYYQQGLGGGGITDTLVYDFADAWIAFGITVSSAASGISIPIASRHYMNMENG